MKSNKLFRGISIVFSLLFAIVGTSCSTYDMSSISFSDASYTYDGEQKSLQITGTLPAGVTVTYANNDKTDVGIYEVVASFTGDRNHKEMTDMIATLTIEKATVTGISFLDSNVVYDGAEHSILITGTLPAGVSVSYLNNGKTDTGIYEVTASFTSDSNFNSMVDLTATLTIEKATVSGLSFLDSTVVYDTAEHSIFVTGTLPTGISVSYLNNGKIDNGIYEVTAQFSDDSNYNHIADMTATLTIEKATITGITFTDAIFAYDGGEHSVFINGDLPAGISVSYSDNALISVGKYLITASFIISNDNYNPLPELSANLMIYDDVNAVTQNGITYLFDLTSKAYTVIGFTTDIATNATISSDVFGYPVTSIADNAFNGCLGLISMTIPLGVLQIGSNAFNGCVDLTTISIPSSVTTIGTYAFYDCSGLATITIPASVTSIGTYTFYNCTSLTTLALPNGVTSIGAYAFNLCSSLTSLTVPSSVVSIGEWAFADCIALTSITIPNGVPSIGANTFANCPLLTTIAIPNSVTTIGANAFIGCYGLVSISVGLNNQFFKAMGGNLYSKNGQSLLFYCPSSLTTSFVIPDGVTKVLDYIFSYCTNLISVTIPGSVDTIGTYAFEHCDNLTTVSIAGSVNSIGTWAFSSCVSLTTINIPSSMTDIGDYAFFGCVSLTTITIPLSVTIIEADAFASCTILTINVVAATKPSGWATEWNSYGCPVVWGYTI